MTLDKKFIDNFIEVSSKAAIASSYYVGKKDKQVSEEIDMTKVFGVDRRVIAPDRNNIEATFLTAKKIDPGATGEIQITLNYKEQ